MQISISSTVKSTPKINGVLFTNMKNKVLGKNFDLSLAFIGTKKIKTLNKKYRNKDYATDILSFNVDKNVGEVVINPDKARQKAPLFERTYDNYLKFIFIHGLFHLKGYEHSSRMESEEERIRKAFKV